MHIFCSINFPHAADLQEPPPQLLRPPAQPRRARVRGRVRPAAAVPPRSRVPRPRAPCAGQQGGYCPCIQYISPLQVPDLTSRCGVRPPGSTQWRVVGGVAAKLHSHPWLAALGYRSQDQVHCTVTEGVVQMSNNMKVLYIIGLVKFWWVVKSNKFPTKFYPIFCGQNIF